MTLVEWWHSCVRKMQDGSMDKELKFQEECSYRTLKGQKEKFLISFLAFFTIFNLEISQYG